MRMAILPQRIDSSSKDLEGCFDVLRWSLPRSAGADPTDYLVKLAKDFEYEDQRMQVPPPAMHKTQP